MAVAGGLHHSPALKGDGTIVGWGLNDFGQLSMPSGLTNVTSIAAGDNHSLALSNGTVIAWGRSNSNQTSVPASATNVIAISAGGDQSLALKTNGTLVQWGQTNAPIPANATNVIAIASGTNFHVALLSNSTVLAWGDNTYGQTSGPTNLTNVVAIAVGGAHALALKTDGTVTNWGSSVGTTPTGLTNVMAVAAGYGHSMVLKNDGTVIAWGTNTYGQTNVVSGLAMVKSIAAGAYHSLAAKFSTLIQYPVDVSKDMLLIYNTNSLDSSNVCAYYLQHRPMVSNANVLGIACPTSYGCPTNETVLPSEYTNQIANPVLNWLNANPTKRPQYVVLFPDIPSRVNDFNGIDTNGLRYYDCCRHDSVSIQIRDIFAGWKPYVTYLNMGATNACKAYIDKLEFFGTNYSLGKLLISTGAGSYWNTNYYFDDAYHATGSTPGASAKDGVIASGVPSSNVTYVSNTTHITTATNVAGYLTWGYNAFQGNDYANNGTIVFTGNSRWYLIETIESHNGDRFGDQGNFLDWFADNAFGGSNYLNTPVGAVCHTDEPNSNWNDPYTYYGRWASGYNFAICAWSSQRTEFFMAVGDPFVKY